MSSPPLPELLLSSLDPFAPQSSPIPHSKKHPLPLMSATAPTPLIPTYGHGLLQVLTCCISPLFSPCPVSDAFFPCELYTQWLGGFQEHRVQMGKGCAEGGRGETLVSSSLLHPMNLLLLVGGSPANVDQRRAHQM